MKRLFSWLITPWLIALVGVMLLSLVIWFEGPLLAFNGREPMASETARQVLIGLLLLTWIAYFGWKWLMARRASQRLTARVVSDGPPEAGESANEVALLRERMQQALATLRKVGSRHGSQYLYQIPWYMFVGAPGSGKTTALLKSGLRFPLAATLGTRAVGGVGGTRNCDWWFTDEAVLLDTAGRYTTQDSQAERDRSAWTGFLDLLAKYRRRQPINGVIIVVSVADLLEQGQEARGRHASAVRERIKEIHDRLQVQFPVYVVVTKSDLLAGFTEFFEGLGKEERMQVWGCTFPLGQSQQVNEALAAFPAEFDALERQLQARVLDRVQQERDLFRRALIYSFPQQFAGIGDLLNQFLRDAFVPTRYEEAALLRGVYFTSGTQEGTPIDRVMGTLAAAFGLERRVLVTSPDSGRSYFLTRLLRDVIFKEAALVGVNLSLERKRRLLQRVAAGVICFGMLLLMVGMLTSYFRNEAYIAKAAQETRDIEQLVRSIPASSNALTVLPALDATRRMVDATGSPPLLSRIGLYQGDKVRAGAELAYRRLLKGTLLPAIVARMESQLRQRDANNLDYLYEQLRVYLMLGDRRHFNAETVRAWVDFDWTRNLANSTEAQRQQMSRHLATLLDASADLEQPVQLDQQLIAQTRLALARLPVSQRVYSQLKREASQTALPEFSVTGAVGQDASPFFQRASGQPLTRGIPGIYTVAGYRRFAELSERVVSEVARDNWVLGRQESTAVAGGNAMITAAVMQLYYQDYIAQWDSLLNDVQVAPVSSLDQGARIATALAGPASPMRKFLQAAAKETTLGGPQPTAASGVTEGSKSRLDAAKKKLESVLGQTGALPVAVNIEPANPVTAHFNSLHELTAASAGGASPLDQALTLLKDAAIYFDAAEGARLGGTPPPPADALNRVKREAEHQPAPLAAVLRGISSSGATLTLGSERARLNALWNAAAAPFCRQAIGGRYPLNRGATQEITPEDFGKFFAPGGLVDEFFQKNLAPLVDTSAPQWRWRAANGGTLGIPQETLQDFQRAARLRDMFFSSGGRQPLVRFSLKPVVADSAWSKVILEIDGQAVSYAPDSASVAIPVQFPSGAGGGIVRFDTAPPARQVLRTEGPWAWLRMMDRGLVEMGSQGERYRLTFDLDGRRVSYDLTASSVINPFRRDALQGFRCLEKL